MCKNFSSVALLFLLAACASSTGSPSLDKAQLRGADGKADSSAEGKICALIGAEPTCDLCDIAGWYGDGECDTFCQQHDSDCGTYCGGWLGDTCTADEFCDFTLDATCGYADASGTCAAKPEACTLQVDPVCGCNGETYSNTCIANAAGTSVLHAGGCEDAGVGEQCGANVCEVGELCCPGCPGQEPFGCVSAAMGCPLFKCVAPPVGNACGGLLGLGCAVGEFCNYAPEAICGAADQTGNCEAIPQACTAQYDPVCGCDDQTYGNECAAHAAGVSVISFGACAN